MVKVQLRGEVGNGERMRRRSLLHRLLGLPAPGMTTVTVHADLEVQMRDGVVLHADRLVPDGRVDAPVSLLRSP